MTSLSARNISAVLLLMVALIVGIGVTAPVGESAPAGLDTIHELNSLTVDVEVAQNKNGQPLNGEPTNNTRGTVTYNVTINAQNPKNVYPYLYPMRVEYKVAGSDSIKGTDTVYMTPTRSPGYVPDPDNNDVINERELQTKYQVTVPYPGVTEDVTVPRTFEVSVESRLTGDTASDTVTSDVRGPIPAGTSGGILENRAGLNEPSSVTFVDTYRISPSEDSASFQESTNLPKPTDGSLAGSIQSFPSMKEASEGGAVLYGDDRGLRMVTLTRNIDSATPQTLVVTYNIETGGSNVTLNPLTPGGEQINEDTQYNLTKDPSDNEHCRTLPRSPNSGNVCIFTLEESEVESINRLGELLLEYEGSTDTRAAIYCQSVVSGYMTAEDETCGTNKAVTSPDIVTIESFEGYHPPDESPKTWSDRVVVSEDGSTDETELNMRLIPQVTGQSSTLPVKWEIYSSSSLGASRDISSSSPKFSGEFPDATDPSASVQRSVSNFDKSRLDPEETYVAVLCPQGSSSCTLENSYDIDDVTFVTPSPPGDPVLRTRNASIILDLDSVNTQIIGEKRLETTDSDYDSQFPEWECVRGPAPRCSQDTSDSDFTGEIVQDVTVEDVTGTEAEKVIDGELISRAEDKRSDIEGGSWNSDERTQTLVNRDRQIVYATESNAPVGPGWNRISETSIRSAETGRTTSYFGVQGRVGFATVVESETEWYPLRGDDFTGGGPENPGLDQFEYQNIDPDKCLNCLPGETVSQAETRLSNTDGVSLVETLGGSDLWVKTSDEPVRENTVGEQSFGYEPTVTERSAPAQLYNNISLSTSTDDSKKYLYRNTQFKEPEGPGTSGENRKPIYEWKLDSNTPQVEFERPVSEPIYKYQRYVYDAEYTFRGEVTSPRDLYVYAKEVTEEVATYNEKVHWFDISESYVEGSGTLTGFEVRFDGSEYKYPLSGPIDWSEEVHNNTKPTELTQGRNNITAYCNNLNSDSASYSDLVTVEIPDQYHGDGGRVVTQNCPASDGSAVEDKVVRIGKYYDTPEPQGYSVNFTLYAGSETDTEPQYTVNVSGEDKVSDPFNPGTDTNPSPPPAPPEIRTIGPINEKVDYRAGTVAVSGTIGSDTERLPMDGSYRLTVKPADDVDTIGNCSELSDYSTNTSYQVQSQVVSGDTLREVVRCQMSGFYNYDKVPQSFTLYEVVTDAETDSTTTNYNQIPEGAIQDCLPPLELSGGGGTTACIADSDDFPTLSSDKIVEFGGKNDPTTGGSLQAVDKKSLGQRCPANYEKESRTVDNLNGQTTYYECVIIGDAEFELKSRQISVRYENVRAGVIQECSNIPTSSETGNTHSGYEEDTSTPNSYTRCQLVDASDPGPDEFNISEQVVIDGEQTSEFKDIPAGAVRGETISSDYVPPECNNPDIAGDENAMKCDVNGETIRYGSVEYGNYLSTSSTTTKISNQGDAQKTVWRGGFVLDGNEQFTTTINPRNTSYSLESPGSTSAKFTFELRDPDGAVIDTETVDVTLCRAQTLTSIGQLPLEQYPNGCENFDTLLDGTDTLISDEGNNTVSDALSAVPDSGTTEFTVHTMANDGCPYNRKYPRQHNTLRSEVFSGGLDITLESGDSASDVRDKIQKKLQSRYAIGGTLCNDDDESTPTPSKKDKSNLLYFNKDSFTGLQSSEDRDFVRAIGPSELHFHTVNPVQTDWNNYEGAIRLGSPLLGNISAQPQSSSERLELISHYPFDHNPAVDSYVTGLSLTYPNHYVIQDVYHPVLRNTKTAVVNGEPVGDVSEGAIDINADESTRQVYQARLWYASSCNTGSDTLGTQKISGPQAADGLDSAYRSCSPSPEVTTTSPSTSPQLTQEEVINSNYWDEDFQVNGDQSTSNAVETPLADQGAFLYAPPTEQMQEVLQLDISPYDRTSIVEENYADSGIFGGRALELNTNSWMMLTPPCMNGTAVEQGAQAGDNLYDGECNAYDNNDVYRGGYSDAYDTPPQSSSGYRDLYDEIQSKNGDDNSYTVSFWVKEGNNNLNSEFDSLNPTTTKRYDPGNKASNEQQPFNTLMSVSIPAHAMRDSDGTTPENTADQGTGNRNLQSSARISIMRTPTSIDVSDLGGPFLDRDTVYPQDGWIYGSDTNLRSRFENCIATNDFGTDYSSDEEPILCEVWYQDRGGEPVPIENIYNIRDARLGTTPDDENGDEFDYESQYNDFLNSVYDRIEWKWSYSYPVEANSVRRVESESPAFSDSLTEVTDFPTKQAGVYEQSDEECEMANVQVTGDGNTPVSPGNDYTDFTYHGPECYQDSTYLFRQDSTTRGINQSPVPSHYQGSDWTHVAISYDDGEAPTTERDRGTLSIYINGVKRGQAPSTITDCTQQSASGPQTVGNCPQDGVNPHFDGTGLDTGRLYENGVISIGGHYQAAGYTTDVDSIEEVNSVDGMYIPMLRASAGNVYVDEMRVYSGSISDARVASGIAGGPTGGGSVFNTMVGDELPFRKTVEYADGTRSYSRQYVGEIKTARQSQGDLVGRNVSQEFNESRAVRVSTTAKGYGYYEVGVIPCTSSECYESAEAVVSNRETVGRLGGKVTTAEIESKLARFDTRVLERNNVDEIQEVRLRVKMASPIIEWTPKIQQIRVRPVPSPIDSCQELQEEYDSFSGNRNETVDMLIDGQQATVQCDFETQDGGWTKFAWFDQGQVNNTEGIGSSTTPLSSQISLADCSLSDEECFATPDFEPPTNVNLSDYEYANSTEELNGQILIKAKNDGETVDWAAIEFEKFANYVDLSGSGVTAETNENLGTNETMEWAENASIVLQNGEDNVETRPSQGLYSGTDDYSFAARPPNDVGDATNCLYPYAHGDEYSSTSGRCLTSYAHTATTSSSILHLGQMRNTQISSVSDYQEDFTYVRMVREQTDSGLEIRNLECLDKTTPEIDTCELYYSTGHAFNTTEPDSASGSFDFSEDTLNIDPSYYWTADAPDVDYTSSPETMFDSEGLIDLTQNSDSNTGTIEAVDGFDGSTREAISLGGGDNGAFNYTQSSSILDDQKTTVVGHFKPTDTGTMFEVGYADGPTAGPLGGAVDPALPNPIRVELKDGGSTIEVKLRYLLEDSSRSTSVALGNTMSSSVSTNSNGWSHFGVVWDSSDPQNPRATLYVNGRIADDLSSSEILQTADSTSGLYTADKSNEEGGIVTVGASGDFYKTIDPESYGGSAEEIIVTNGEALLGCEVESLYRERLKNGPTNLCGVGP